MVACLLGLEAAMATGCRKEWRSERDNVMKMVCQDGIELKHASVEQRSGDSRECRGEGPFLLAKLDGLQAVFALLRNLLPQKWTSLPLKVKCPSRKPLLNWTGSLLPVAIEIL